MSKKKDVAKYRIEEHEDGTHVMFQCPGCNAIHSVVDRGRPHTANQTWEVFQTEHGLTLHPSVLVTWRFGEPGRKAKTCHSYVKNGHIQFLNDCFHELAGKTVPMVDYDWSEW